MITRFFVFSVFLSSALFLFSAVPPVSAQSTCIARPADIVIHLTGFTRARASMDIISEVSGRCLEVRADVGQPVPRDSIFALIDPTFTRIDLEANRVARQQTKRQLRFEEQEVGRYRQLLSDRASSQARLDALELKRDQSELQLNRLINEQRRLQETLDRHSVRAPAGWLIMDRTVQPGQWVIAGTPLARAGDYRRLIVPLAVTLQELHGLQNKQSIPLSLPDSSMTSQATIYRISPAFDPQTRKIRVELLLDEASMARLPEKQGGLRAEISLHVPDPMHAFLVPARAVEERYEENWLTRENGDTLRVIVLGPAQAPEGDKTAWLRVTSPEIHSGDVFRLSPPSAR